MGQAIATAWSLHSDQRPDCGADGADGAAHAYADASADSTDARAYVRTDTRADTDTDAIADALTDSRAHCDGDAHAHSLPHAFAADAVVTVHQNALPCVPKRGKRRRGAND